jgi:hypothetical protein
LSVQDTVRLRHGIATGHEIANNPATETIVDLNNNEVGRRLARDIALGDLATCRSRMRSTMVNGLIVLDKLPLYLDMSHGASNSHGDGLLLPTNKQ